MKALGRIAHHTGRNGERDSRIARVGEDKGGGCSEGSASKYVPHVVLVGIYPAPCHVCADEVCWYAPFPSVTLHQIGGSIEGQRRVGAREGVITCAVGARLLDGSLKGIVGYQCGGCTQSELGHSLRVVLND